MKNIQSKLLNDNFDYFIGNRFNFRLERLPFLFAKNLKGMTDMYFTDTFELRKFEREMRQKPNFDRHNVECDENEISHFSDNKNFNTNRKKDGG